MQIVSNPGRYVYESVNGEPSAVCGVYIVAAADQLVEVEFEAIQVTCKQGLVVVRIFIIK